MPRSPRCAARWAFLEEFRPQLEVSWYKRGENAFNDRRAELRRVAQTRIDALHQAAIVQIETVKVEGLELLARDGLESAEAQAFLNAMPTVEVLMPRLNVPELTKPQQAGARDAISRPGRVLALAPHSRPSEDDRAF